MPAIYRGSLMRLTTKGRYAVTAMLDLAINQQGGTISLADISSRQEISLSYLEQLFSKLRKNGLVQSVRGPGGGYRLAVDAAEISVAAIVDAVDELIDATNCKGMGNCNEGHMCLTHHLWMDLSEQIREFLRDISLASLLERREIQAVAQLQNSNSAGNKIPLTSL